jgi:hypothetical protein
MGMKKEGAGLRTMHIGEPQFECGSVIQLPSGSYACVLRKLYGESSWRVQRVDVAKRRLIDGSDMELSAKHLAQAKLAYSAHVWADLCLQARREEYQRKQAQPQPSARVQLQRIKTEVVHG